MPIKPDTDTIIIFNYLNFIAVTHTLPIPLPLLQDSSAEFEVQVFNNTDITVYLEITQDYVKLKFPTETVSNRAT